MDTTDINRSELERILKAAADLIRTRVDYKYILILLFLKRISDKWEMEFGEAFQKVRSKGLSEKEATEEAKDSDWHDFNLPEEYLWENIRKDVSKLPETLSGAMKAVAELNPELKDIMDRMDFFEFTSSRENQEILRQLVELFSERKLHHVSPDILGDAYEWIIRYFAPQKAKEGEVYTPREVITLLIEILNPSAGELVYDPACGSGGMLIGAYDHLRKKNGDSKAKELFLYGQEANLTTLAISKMNLYIHDIRDAVIEYGDTLRFPKFMDGKELKRFDVVIANPPWNQDGYDETVLKGADFAKQRYRYGHVPKQYADWAWIQHMLASAKDDTGRVGIVIDGGCLFRGGKEKTIRTRALEDDLVESVILLPEKLFYNTPSPGAIVVFNKNKPKERKGKVLFINASGEYEQHPEVRKLNRLGERQIARIAGVYGGKEVEDGYSRVVPLEEIKGNDYNLNVTLYVMPEEKAEDIDIAREWADTEKIDREISEINTTIKRYLQELGVSR